MTRRIPYDPALDGLRAVAVVSVMLYHAGVDQVPGGFLGVDVFFVLSGYLITTLLLKEHDASGRVDLLAFWGRRARRLLPALALVLAWVMVYAAWIAPEVQGSGVRGDLLATLLYVANWHDIAQDASYFDLFGAPSPLAHTWSLAIEEQWYLIWPLVVALWLRSGTRRGLSAVVLIAAGVAASAITMVIVADPVDPSRAYYGTDARVQALLVGALTAALLASRTQRLPRLLGAGPLAVVGLAGALAVLAMMALVQDSDLWMYDGGFLLAALASAVVIVSIRLAAHGPLARVLGFGPFPWVGRISYGLYLWHWPMFVWLTPTRTGMSGIELVLFRLLVTSAVAVASYYAFERTVQRANVRRGVIPVGGVAIAGLAFAMVVALPGAGGANVPDRLRITAGEEAAFGSPTQERVVAPKSADATMTPVATATPTPEPTTPNTDLHPAPTSNTIAGPVAEPGEPLRTMVVGDSVYLELALAYDDPDHRARMTITADVRLGCGTVRDEANPQCSGRVDSWRASAAEDAPDIVLLGLSKWDVSDLVVGGNVVEFGTDEHTEILMASWQEDLDAVRSEGVQVVMVTVGCMNGRDDQLGTGARLRTDPDRTAAVNRLAADFVASTHGVSLLDIRLLTCPDGRYREQLDGVPLHRDGVHYTDEAMPLIWEWLTDEIGLIAGGRG